MIAMLRDISDRVERRRELEEKIERLDRFAGIVSHDLRTPLSIVEDAVDRMDEMLSERLQLTREGDVPSPGGGTGRSDHGSTVAYYVPLRSGPERYGEETVPFRVEIARIVDPASIDGRRVPAARVKAGGVHRTGSVGAITRRRECRSGRGPG